MWYEKKSLTTVEKACQDVAGFSELHAQLERKISLSGRSVSTLRNYGLHLAHMALHCGCLPTELDQDQIEDYLFMLKERHHSPSESSFKHAVYGLRFVFRLVGRSDGEDIDLPILKREKKLPEVLSQQEMRLLLKAPELLKHRILLALTYGCGLRMSEARNLKIVDVDLNRDMVLVRNGKGRKSRYVPFGEILHRGIVRYLESECPKEWLFNGKQHGEQLSPQGVQWVIRMSVKKASIAKQVSCHTLRHSYATHLLEMGLDIVSVKTLLGHERIETTMVYLHVARVSVRSLFSPLEGLYQGS